MQEPWQVYGLADIGVVIERPTRCIVLHATDMVVREANLEQNPVDEGSPSMIPARRSYNEFTEQLTLIWDDPIPIGYAALHLKFDYHLSSGMSGFYKSTYSLPNGQQGTLAATQFEANSARAAFPCFDEPQLKAVFAVEVITDKDMKVLSNMPTAAMHRVSFYFFTSC